MNEQSVEVVRPVVSRWAVHRRMYDWTMSFAESRHAVLALGAISFAESSFFPIPPDVLMVPMMLKKREKTWWYATWTVVTSVVGGFAGYLIGYALVDVAAWIIGEESLTKIQEYVNEYGFWGMFVAAVLVSPFKVVTIAAGFAHMDLFWFGLASLLGRAKRIYVVAAVVWFVGPRVLPLLDKYFNPICLGLAAVVIAVIVAMQIW